LNSSPRLLAGQNSHRSLCALHRLSYVASKCALSFLHLTFPHLDALSKAESAPMNSIAKEAATVTERLVFLNANPPIEADLVTVTGSNVTRREEKKLEEKDIVRTIT